MRDIAFTSIVIIGALCVFKRAWWGVLLLAWLGYMNAQRLCFGFAVYFPFFAIVVTCTVIAMLLSGEEKSIPWAPPVWLLVGLIIWMNVCFVFALNPEGAWWEWNRTMRNVLFLFLSLMAIRSRHKLEMLTWTMVASFGFYGVKGGIFTFIHGGVNTVSGPENTMIGDNNQLAVALAMTMPLMRYLQLQTEKKRVRWILTGIMLLTAIAILGTYSRAGFISIGVVAVVMWFKSRRKLLLAIVLPIATLLLLSIMPEKWAERMNTIKSYNEDASTLGRFNAWHFATNLANDRPLVGGGFGAFTPQLFQKYAPEPDNFHAAHSIYFQMLGDSGYPGLLLFVGFLGTTWVLGTIARKRASRYPDMAWVGDMTAMIQTSLAVYMIGGASLSLAYFEFPYQLATMIVVCHRLVLQHAPPQEETSSAEDEGILYESLKCSAAPA